MFLVKLSYEFKHQSLYYFLHVIENLLQTEQANELIYNAGLNYYALYMDCAGSENSNPSGHMLRYAVDMNMLFPNKTLTHLIKKLPRTQQVCFLYTSYQLFF